MYAQVVKNNSVGTMIMIKLDQYQSPVVLFVALTAPFSFTVVSNSVLLFASSSQLVGMILRIGQAHTGHQIMFLSVFYSNLMLISLIKT